MAMLGSVEIIESLLLTKQETIAVKKSIWDKFLDFCLQWNPCDPRGVSPDTMVINAPSDEVFMMGNKIICHPSMLPKLRQAMREGKT